MVRNTGTSGVFSCKLYVFVLSCMAIFACMSQAQTAVSGTAGPLVGWGAGQIPTGHCFVAITGGSWHGLGIKSDGSLVAWGLNYDGQCNVPAGNDFVAVVAGGGHSLAIKSDDSLVACGDNNYGQRNIPAGTDFVTIAAGSKQNLAVLDLAVDWNVDGCVNWGDFGIFASHWLETGCVEPDWCGGVDKDHSGQVNWADFGVFADHWLMGCQP